MSLGGVLRFSMPMVRSYIFMVFGEPASVSGVPIRLSWSCDGYGASPLSDERSCWNALKGVLACRLNWLLFHV